MNLRSNFRPVVLGSVVLTAFVGGLAGPSFGANDKTPPYKTGIDQFEFTYEVELPKLAPKEKGSMWIPVPRSDGVQKVTELKREWPKGQGLTPFFSVDRLFKNGVQQITFGPDDKGKMIRWVYRVERKEKSSYPVSEKDVSLYLRSEPLVPVDEKFKKIASEVTAGKKSDMERGRAIYDYVLAQMKYDKSGTGWGRGDAVYACDIKTGNCTDFHALFMAVARSAGIPARFAIGFTIPSTKDEGVIDGYHCWAEFLADGKWVPIDISEAWKAPEANDYYFGHHPANRFEISVGRFFDVTPKPAAGQINFLVHPYLEVDGKAQKFAGAYRFKRLPAAK